ncbi:MAG: hypothetical protein IJT38_03720 [Clostridia bacterium]|nr:hypothetical protein [Clostridia bacterium]
MIKKDYVTNFMKRRSIIALCAGVLTVILAFYGMIAGVNKTNVVLGKDGFLSFIYFTMIANTLAMLSAAFTIPFAVEGMRKKRFTLPRWIALMHYSATVSVTIMMLCVICFISWVSPDDAFGGANIVTHIFCPVLILISFFQIENEYTYTMKNQSLGMIPLCLYIIAYFIEVILIGEANGGWPDIYRVKELLPYWLAIPMLFLFGLCVSFLIRIISNRLTNIRRAKMFALLKDDAKAEEIFKEAYSIGVMIGLKGEKNNIRIPYDILEYFAEKYRLNVDDLTKFFVDGIIDGLKDRNKDNNYERDKSREPQ